MFHISHLRCYVQNDAHVLDYGPLQVAQDLTYEARPIRISDVQEIELRQRVTYRVLVQWEYHTPQEATWEFKDEIREQYPELFTSVA